jgi:UPF0755 protein
MSGAPDPPPSGRARAAGEGKGEKGTRRTRRVRRRREPAQGASTAKKVASAVALLLGVALAACASYVFVVYPASAGPGQGKDVELVIAPGAPRGAVASQLAELGLVQSARLFQLYATVTSATFAPGRHLLTDEVTPGDLVRRLERLEAGTRARVTIPEGWTRFDIARRLHALGICASAAFVEASADAALLRELAIDGESAEGFLFPATYELPKDSDARDVVRRLKVEMDRRFALLEQAHRLGLSQLEASLGWGRREILTLASMIEKEAAVDEERPVVASVFLNRLRDPSFKRKVLQCDPTAGYGCLALKDRVPACAGYAGKITHAINFDPLNAYSTYVREGLPPGPIANPGTKSIQAVLAPATTKYLFFVAREGRRHTFSESLDDHNTAVKDLRDRKGEGHPN